MKYPEIKTLLPGPRAAALIEVDRRFVSPSYTRSYPLVAESAEGLWIRDPDGNLFLDFTAGIAVCATGHCHPLAVQEAFRKGLLLLGCGHNTLRFCPALTVSAEEIDVCLEIFEEVMRKLL